MGIELAIELTDHAPSSTDARLWRTLVLVGRLASDLTRVVHAEALNDPSFMRAMNCTTENSIHRQATKLVNAGFIFPVVPPRHRDVSPSYKVALFRSGQLIVTMPNRPEPAGLYHLTGAAGRLLYIGISRNPKIRFRDHARDKPWWPEVQKATVQRWYRSRPAAEAAEIAAINRAWPPYNNEYRAPKRLRGGG